jgi:hypothetical protein
LDSLAFAGCAPKAKIMEGDIAQRVQQGIALGRDSFDHSKFNARRRKNSDRLHDIQLVPEQNQLTAECHGALWNAASNCVAITNMAATLYG